MTMLRALPGQVSSVSKGRVSKTSLSPRSSTTKKNVHKWLHSSVISHCTCGCCCLLFCWAPLRRPWCCFLQAHPSGTRRPLTDLSSHCLVSRLKGPKPPNLSSQVRLWPSQWPSPGMLQLLSISPAPGDPNHYAVKQHLCWHIEMEENPCTRNGWWPHFRAIFGLLRGLGKVQAFGTWVCLQLHDLPHLIWSRSTERWQISPHAEQHRPLLCGREKCSKYHLRSSERRNSTAVIPQNNKTRQPRKEKSRGR